MTLKRRLFISNIIMTVLPLLLIGMVTFMLFGTKVPDDPEFRLEKEETMKSWYRQVILNSAIILALAIFIITTVNQLLTRNIIKRIMRPLDTLSMGARRFSENNLGFRLDYRDDDEFRPVCDTFNEMAVRLETMKDERQKNDDNRRELIAGISHDLRTPLTSIKMSIDGIKTGVAATDEQRKKYTAIIENKTVELEHIINQLFLFSKLDMGEFSPETRLVNCGLLLEDCIEELSGEYVRRGLALIARVLPRDMYVSIDPVLFRRVIINIFENAAIYKTAEMGHITIDCIEEAKNVKICLADDGPGVRPENLEKLFDVFYRADQSRNKKGSGLGLAISAKIIAKMGGSIRAELPSAGGLAIVIVLPLAVKDGDNGK
jgi:signal transduction histidine kinase